MRIKYLFYDWIECMIVHCKSVCNNHVVRFDNTFFMFINHFLKLIHINFKISDWNIFFFINPSKPKYFIDICV